MEIINCVGSAILFMEMFVTPDIMLSLCGPRDIRLYFH